ncbi:nucleoside triphosphate pyrophosphohydrolase [Streptococcus sp.]|uniref:nucleoside triphosphate pyrophosphohydrolase n=1 Tax=Streptococcus sp. TaxID=1306 RepID=UPI00180053DE|nr:nucleoside triphosphate pyrophosphohydrolase [Streptococcus sp.]HHU65184.1 nucleoside triphosphate pyrophosphohydrolase [Streptococcus sp.]
MQIINKLVRDNIPNIIQESHGNPIVRVLDTREFIDELFKKFDEEIKEVYFSNGEERCRELADVLEIINTLAYLEGKNLEYIIELSKEKRKKNGGFKDRIFLERIDY